jgi:hypothetical protein
MSVSTLTLQDVEHLEDYIDGQYPSQGEWTRAKAVISKLRLIVSDRLPASPAIIAFADERRRQIEKEGWTPEHDDDHVDGELSGAAACYAPFGTTYKIPERPSKYAAINMAREAASGGMDTLREAMRIHAEKNPRPPSRWPWEDVAWKPSSRKRNIEKAAALLAAEWERIDRAEKAAASISMETSGHRKPASTVRQVAAKMLAINEYDQREVARRLGLHEAEDDGKLDYEAALAAVRRAGERGRLGDLDFALDSLLEVRT